MQNLLLNFDWHYIEQKKGEDFAKFCGLLKIYEFKKDLLDWIFSKLSAVSLGISGCLLNVNNISSNFSLVLFLFVFGEAWVGKLSWQPEINKFDEI